MARFLIKKNNYLAWLPWSQGPSACLDTERLYLIYCIKFDGLKEKSWKAGKKLKLAPAKLPSSLIPLSSGFSFLVFLPFCDIFFTLFSLLAFLSKENACGHLLLPHQS